MAKRKYRFGDEYYLRLIDRLVARRYFEAARFIEVDIDSL